MKMPVRWLGACLLSLLAVTAAAAAAGVRDPDSPTILLTGSNRGVGLALAREYAAQGWNVIATCRTPRKADELKALAAANPKVLIEELDVTDVGQIEKLARRYRGVPIDVLFNNAGLAGHADRGPAVRQARPEAVRRGDEHQRLRPAEAVRSLRVQRGGQQAEEDHWHDERPRLTDADGPHVPLLLLPDEQGRHEHGHARHAQ